MSPLGRVPRVPPLPSVRRREDPRPPRQEAPTGPVPRWVSGGGVGLLERTLCPFKRPRLPFSSSMRLGTRRGLVVPRRPVLGPPSSSEPRAPTTRPSGTGGRGLRTHAMAPRTPKVALSSPDATRNPDEGCGPKAGRGNDGFCDPVPRCLGVGSPGVLLASSRGLCILDAFCLYSESELRREISRLGTTTARLKPKGIDGGLHKRWSMWFNSTQRAKPYQCLTSSKPTP